MQNSTYHGATEAGRSISLEAVDAYVSDIQKRFRNLNAVEQMRCGALTLEVLLQRVYTHFFNGKGGTVLPDTLPFAIRHVPSLEQAAQIQSRISSRLMCAVASRPLVTLYELEQEIAEEEGVEAYADVGLGPGLQCFPLAQQYFKVRSTSPIYPVTSHEVFHFFLYNSEAMPLLQGSGDVRDLMNSFCSYYEKRFLTTPPDKVNAQRTLSSCVALPKRIGNTRHLGIHIQNFPWFMTIMRQEVGRLSTITETITSGAKRRMEKNTAFYERVVTSLDAELAEHDAKAATHPRPLSVSSAIRCDVCMTTEEARQTTIPLPQWRRCTDGPMGKACLTILVSPDESVRLPRVECATTFTDSAKSGIPGSVAITPSDPLAGTPVELSHVSARRSRRCVVREAGPSLALAQDGGTNFCPLAPQPCFTGLSCVPSVTAPEHMAQIMKNGNDKADGFVDPSCPVDVLRSYLDAGDEYLSAASVLADLRVGMRVESNLVISVLLRWQNAIGTSSGETFDTACKFIPIPQRCHAREISERAVCASQCGVWEIVDMAAPAEVCWQYALNATEGTTAKGYSLFHHDLSRYYGEKLKHLFVNYLKVSLHPVVCCWLASARVIKCAYPACDLNDDFLQSYLGMMEHCVLEEYHHRLKGSLLESASSADSIFHHWVESMPEGMSLLYLFPYRYAWRRGVDNLFYAGPHYFGLSGLHLKSTNIQAAGYPHVLQFSNEPHYALAAVLRHCKVLPVEACVIQTVSFTELAPANESADLHQRIAHLVPYVQRFLSYRDPALWHVCHITLARRLSVFRVVLGRDVVLRERMYDFGIPYLMATRLGLRYVAQHNTLYGACECFTAPVVADAALSIFFPLAPEASLREELRHVLERLLSVITSTEGNLRNERREDLHSALEREAHSLLLGPLIHCVGSDTDISPLTISAAPAGRYQAYFPPSTDGISNPPFDLTERRHLLLLPDICGDDQDNTDVQNAERQRWVVNPSSTGQFSVQSLPQWMCTMFDEPQEVLRAVQTSTSGVRLHKKPGYVCDVKEDEATDGCISFNAFRTRKRTRGDESLPSRFPCVSGNTGRDGTAAYAIEAERFVFEKLQAEYKSDSCMQVVWVNERAEQGTPYDILVVRKQAHTAHRMHRDDMHIVAYVEVKCTSTRNRRDFELSLRELLFAARYGGAYKVYRVYGASTSELRHMSIQVYSDLVQLWHTGKLSMTGEVRVLPSF